MRTLLLGFGLAFGCVLLRAFSLQVLERPELAERGHDQVDHAVEVESSRGRILDRSGATTLAGNVVLPRAFVDPELFLRDPRAHDVVARAQVAALLGIERDKLERALARGGRYVRLASRLGPDVARKVRSLGFAGIGFEDETWRVYPARERAGHVIGFVGRDGRGLEGLELAADEELAGEGYWLEGQRDGNKRPLHTEGLGDHPLSPSGKDVLVTLDLGIQQAAEEELARAVSASGARAGTAIVLAPATGDVLALAVFPAFNPNDDERLDAERWRDRAVTDLYEPGSTIKPFTAAAALEAGLVSEATPIDCHHGAWKFADHVIHDHSPHDTISFADVIRVSSNIGVAQIGLTLGAERLVSTLTRFGFGERTGVGLPGEVRGVLFAAARMRPIQVANVAFGHGLSVTPMQLAAAYGALANGGVRMAPRLVLGVRDPVDGESALQIREPVAVERAIAPETAARVTALLEEVTSADGTGAAARLPGVRVAGKTGTAEKVRADGRGYDADRVVASFAGYVPADDPRLVIVVAIDEPTGPATFGGQVAAPVFREIARRALPIVGVPVGVAPSAPIPAFAPEALRIARAEETADGRARPRAEGGAGVRAPGASRGAADRGRGLPPDRATGEHGVVPDLAGLSVRAALRESARLGVPVSIEGRGLCVAQEPAAGEPLAVGGSLRAWFAPAGALDAPAAPGLVG
ncbi:MAG: penicillin-binding protein [bacterium]